MRYTQTKFVTLENLTDANAPKVGQWVKNEFGQRGQFLGVTLTGTVVSVGNDMQSLSGTTLALISRFVHLPKSTAANNLRAIDKGYFYGQNIVMVAIQLLTTKGKL